MKKTATAFKNCAPEMSLMIAPNSISDDRATLISKRAIALKKEFNFKEKYDLEPKLIDLVNDIILEHDVMQQSARIKQSVAWLNAFSNHITQLKKLSACSSPQTRGMLLEEMGKQAKIPVAILHRVEAMLEMLDEGDIQILLNGCNLASQKIDIGGIEKRTPLHIAIPRIVKIFEEGVKPKKSGARQKATCYSNSYTTGSSWDGAGFKFAIAINALLKKINPKLRLGSDSSIGSYLKKGKKPRK